MSDSNVSKLDTASDNLRLSDSGDTTQKALFGEFADQMSSSQGRSEIDYMAQRFTSIDTDNNDFASAEELLDFADQSGSALSEHEIETIELLARRERKLAGLHEDEWSWSENDGITRQDLAAANQRISAYNFADENFTKLDDNSDGHIDNDELNRYQKKQGNSLSDSAVDSLAYLNDHMSTIEEYNNDEFGDENDGFTEADIEQARRSEGISDFDFRPESDPDSLPSLEIVEPAEFEINDRIASEDIADVAVSLFSQIDLDNDSYLSESELGAAVQDGQYTGQEAQVVAALYEAQDEFEEMSNDEFLDENSGITRSDLYAYDDIKTAEVELRDNLRQSKNWLERGNHFENIDSSQDNYLSLTEINQALNVEALSDTDRTNLEFLRDNYSMLKDRADEDPASVNESGIEGDGITFRDISLGVEDSYSDIQKPIGRTWNLQRRGSHELYDNHKNPLESITPDAVNQGYIGDCYFEAAVASIAATQPETIRDMIADNGDGTYTVTFPGAPDEPVTVEAPTEAEMGLFNQGEEYGTWSTVLEKAFGKHAQQHFWRRSIFNMDGGDTLIEGGDGGEILHGRALSLLTGEGRDVDSLSMTRTQTLQRKLTEALSGDTPRPVLASISKQFITSEAGQDFPDGHMYSIIGYDPEGADGGTVTVRNPWGIVDGTTSGTIDISLEEFQDNFTSVIYSE